MAGKKKKGLDELDGRVGQVLTDYIIKHNLLPKGKRYRLTLDIRHHKTGHYFTALGKTTKAHAEPSGEPMTEEDWDKIFKLPCFKDCAPDMLHGLLLEVLRQLKESNKPIAFSAGRAQQLNQIFQGNGLMYHVFAWGGTTWKPQYRIFKKL